MFGESFEKKVLEYARLIGKCNGHCGSKKATFLSANPSDHASISKHESLLAATVKAAAEAKELAELRALAERRQLQRQRSAQQAEIKARADALAAIAEAEAAEKRAKAEQQAAIEAERQRVEQERLDAEKVVAARAADEENRKRVIDFAIDDLVSHGISRETAAEIVEYISLGEIKGVSINF